MRLMSLLISEGDLIDLYVAHTPYHLLLSIMNGCLERKSLIILLDIKGTLGWYADDKVKSFFRHAYIYVNFDGRTFLQKLCDKNPLIGTIFYSNVGKLIGTVDRLCVRNLYLFNDSFPEVQLIAKSSRAKEIIYLEDGAAPYNSHKVWQGAPHIFQKLMFGPDYERIDVLGTSSYIQRSLVLYPEIVRAENKIKPLLGFSVVEGSRHHLERFFNLFDIGEYSSLRDTDVSLYLLPPYMDRRLLAAISKMIAKDAAENLKPLVKYHPIGMVSNAFDISVSEVSKHVPVELILMHLRKVKKICSYPSTSLMTARFLFPHIDAECLVVEDAKRDKLFEERMSFVGINISYI